MRAHSKRSAELVQYSHIIHMASQTFTWDNVYMYDKDFHLHLVKHPGRSWGIILQQAWMVRLKDRVKFKGEGNDKRNDICKMFNQG